MSNPKIQDPIVKSITDLSTTQAKWTGLKQIAYIDERGTERLWEMAVRRTRGTSGVDAVAIGNIILHPCRPPTTVLVKQFRPPLNSYTIEWPAGLVDADETVEQAAVRELKEETGYEGRVISLGPVVATDPGLTNANMQLCLVEVKLREGDVEPQQSLDEGECIERITVPLAELYERLVAFVERDGVSVAAKLFHFAAGMHFARNSGYV